MGKLIKNREYSFHHCQQRAKERYGIFLTRQDWEDWAEDCRNSISSALYTNVNGRVIQTTHVIYYWGMKFIVVYENKRDCITTLLPPEKDYHFAGRLSDKPQYHICGCFHRPSERCAA
jgi:hypothetical protein